MSTNETPVRDGWVGKFLALRNAAADPKLNRTDLAVLACILDHHGSGGAKPGYQRMSRMTQVDRRTVIRSVQRLQSLGYLTIEGRDRQTNIYRPVFPTSVTWPTSGVAVTSDIQTTELVVQVSLPLVGQLSPEPEAIEPEAIKPKAMIEIALIPLKDKSEFQLSSEQLSEFQKAYPRKDIFRELQQMRTWSLSNPTKMKTKAGVLKFMNAWLSRPDYKPSINQSGMRQNFQDTEYKGTPIDRIPNSLRAFND